MAALLRARAKSILQLAPAQLSGAMLQRAQAAGGLLPRAPAAGGLLPRAPAAGGLLPRAPAAGGLLASGSLRQRLFVRLMCGDSRQFVRIKKEEYEILRQKFLRLEEAKRLDTSTKESYFLLAEIRSALPLKLRWLDKIVFFAKGFFIPSTFQQLRNVMAYVICGCFFLSVQLYKVGSLHQLKIKIAIFVEKNFPWLAVIFDLRVEDQVESNEKGEKKK